MSTHKESWQESEDKPVLNEYQKEILTSLQDAGHQVLEPTEELSAVEEEHAWLQSYLAGVAALSREGNYRAAAELLTGRPWDKERDQVKAAVIIEFQYHFFGKDCPVDFELLLERIANIPRISVSELEELVTSGSP